MQLEAEVKNETLKRAPKVQVGFTVSINYFYGKIGALT